MSLSPSAFLIVCPMLFLAGLVDSIAGGGGLISLPAYLLAGLPVHTAIGTNKLSSSCGLACEFPCTARGDVEAIAVERKIDVTAYHDMEAL